MRTEIKSLPPLCLFRRKRKCQHEWHNVNEQCAPDDYTLKSWSTYITIYCPKCDKRDSVNQATWKTMDGIQRVRKQWEAEHNGV